MFKLNLNKYSVKFIKNKPRITHKRLREVLHYNPKTGVFTWLVSNSNAVKIGSKAGRLTTHKYIQIQIDGIRYHAHVLAWFYITKNWPKYQIDHKNLNKSDNKWKNLREANNSQNQCNRTIQINNTSGYKGVSFHKIVRLYAARIGVNGKRIHLGYRKTAEEASELYIKAVKNYHGEFARII